MDLVTQAFVYANKMHQGQLRKSKCCDPYISHPFEVMLMLSNNGVTDPAILAASLLHDVVEDTKASHDDILKLFGKEISAYVREVSDDKTLAKRERKKQQLQRIKQASLGAQMIKIADKWSNCRELNSDPPKGWSKADIRGYAVWSLKLCRDTSPKLNSTLRATIEAMFLREFDLKATDPKLDSYVEKYYQSL